MSKRNILTLHGDRGWNMSDPVYTKQSVLRGYAVLNAAIYQLQKANPGITVHSVSHSNLLLPDGLLRIFATVVYSGRILPETLPNHEESEHHGQFDDDENGFDTVVAMYL